jgi:hypothetical protein
LVEKWKMDCSRAFSLELHEPCVWCLDTLFFQSLM